MTLGTLDYVGKGYGFIAGDDGERYFFHYTALDSFGPRFDDLGVGQRVQFTPIAGPKGPRALEVRVMND